MRAHPGGWVEDANGCLLWQGPRHPHGYGVSRHRLMHRVMWEETYGPIPPGKNVLHKCDVKLCGNPEHLFIGTQKDNLQDMSRKGRWGNGTTKLSREAVEKMRALRRSGWRQAELCHQFGVSQAQVSRIVNGVCWR